MGRISPVNLPEFDALYLASNWYRDYIAYCGVADDGKIRMPWWRTSCRAAGAKKTAIERGRSRGCSARLGVSGAYRQLRGLVRVSFEERAGGSMQTFAIRGHVVDLVNDAEEEEEEDSRSQILDFQVNGGPMLT